MRKLSVMAVLSSLVAAACGGAPPEQQQADPEKADQKEVNSAKQPLINGWALTDENYTGLVKLEVFSTSNNAWFTYCSGTLMTNYWIFTASHCFDDDKINGRRPNIRMGSQVTRASTVWRDPSRDIALVTLESSLDMWNWNGSAHATNPPQINNYQYARALAPSNASQDGHVLLCSGVSPGGFGNPPMTIGFFTAQSGPLEMIIKSLPPYNQFHAEGDSGGGCLTDWGLYSAPLGATQVVTFFPADPSAKGPGADQMSNFFWQIWFGLPASIVY